jgi:hypothetical protein
LKFCRRRPRDAASSGKGGCAGVGLSGRLRINLARFIYGRTAPALIRLAMNRIDEAMSFNLRSRV